MSSSLDQLQYNFGDKVPDGAIPLAHIYMNTPNIYEHLKVIGSGKFFSQNIDGLSTRSVATVQLTYNQPYNSNPIIANVLVSNKVLDPSFLHGIDGYDSSTTWTSDTSWSTVGIGEGRTGRVFSNTGSYETGDEPGVDQGLTDLSSIKKCAFVNWNGNVGIRTLTSSSMVARNALEQLYDRNNVIYQLTMWIATDPVDSSNTRRDPIASNSVSIDGTFLQINVYALSASGGIIGTLSSDILGGSQTLSYFRNPSQLFLRYRSSFFKCLDTNISKIKIEITGNNIEGLYIDDVRIRSYNLQNPSNVPTDPNWTIGSDINLNLGPSGNILNNPYMINNSVTNGYFYDNPTAIPNWTPYISQPKDSGIGVLGFGEIGNRFDFLENSVGSNRGHIVFSERYIHRGGSLLQLSQDSINRYFNTEDRIESDIISINTTYNYGLSFEVWWWSDYDNRNLLSAFATPTVTRDSNNQLVFHGGYGYFIAEVWGLNNSNTITENALTYAVGPNYYSPILYSNGIPLSSPGNYKIPVTTPKFTFSNGSTTKAKVIFRFVGSNTGVRIPSLNAYSIPATGVVTVTSGPNTQVYTLSNQIKVDKVWADDSNGWRLLIKDGIFERNYTLSSEEPSGSWLRKVGYRDGDNLNLVYTVPEFNLDPQFNNVFHLQETYKMPCQMLDSKTLFLMNRDIYLVNQIYVNNTVILTGAISSGGISIGGVSSTSYIDFLSLPLQFPDLIESVDQNKGTIKFLRSFNDKDLIQVSYVYRENRYIYKGFYDTGSWNDLDLNPGAGHRFHVGLDSIGQPGKELLNKPITIYLIPTAAYLVSGASTGIYNYKSALDLPVDSRPVSFVRHIIGINSDDPTLIGYPSSAVLAKIFVNSPGSISDVNILDIRSRGGGLPEDWISQNNTEFEEETRVRIPLVSNDWLSTKVILYPNDIFTFVGLGAASGSIGPYQIIPSTSLYAAIATSKPSTGTSGFLIGSSYAATIGYVSSSMLASGLLFLRVSNTSKSVSGELFAIIKTKRKYSQGAVWDINSWSGEPVMMNGVAILEIPKEILTGEDGYRKLTSEQVEEIVNKHTAAGVLPLISYK